MNPDKTVHLQTVVVGRDFGTSLEILSGLKGDEQLVNTPSDILQEGQKIQVLKPSTGAKGAKKGGAAGGQTPDGQASGSQAAASQAPGSRAAQGQTPDGQTPQGQDMQGSNAQPANGQSQGAPGKHSSHHKHQVPGPDTSGQTPSPSSASPGG